MVMSLLNANIPPALAVRYHREKWTDLATCALAGMLRAIPGGVRDWFELPGGGPLMLIEGNVLAALGSREVRQGAGETALAAVELYRDAASLGMRLGNCRSATVVNTAVFMDPILRFLLEFRNSHVEIQSALEKLRAQAKGDQSFAVAAQPSTDDSLMLSLAASFGELVAGKGRAAGG